MDWAKLREPVKVNERALMEQFKEFCYMNGGDITKDLETESRTDMVCKIPGVGSYRFSHHGKVKKVKKAEAPPQS